MSILKFNSNSLNMACELNLEFCTRSCGCANCEHNTNRSKYIPTQKELKMAAEMGLCTPSTDNSCLNCEYISICTSIEAVIVRLENDIPTVLTYGNHKFDSSYLKDIFGLDSEEWDDFNKT